MTNADSSTPKFPWGSFQWPPSSDSDMDFLEVSEEDTRQCRVSRTYVDTPVSLLIQRKKTVGRYYYHPAPLTSFVYQHDTAVESVMQQWKMIDYYTDEMTAALPVKGGPLDLMRVYEQFFRSLTKPPLLESPDVESEETVRELKSTISSLEAQIKNDSFHLRLYRLGAGAFLFGVGSLVIRAFTGLGAPLHPVFAALVIPVSVVVMIMAFLARPDNKGASR